jgi:hypothetical protein
LRHDERTMRRWISGERGVPQGIAILLQLLLDGRITIAESKPPPTRRSRTESPNEPRAARPCLVDTLCSGDDPGDGGRAQSDGIPFASPREAENALGNF